MTNKCQYIIVPLSYLILFGLFFIGFYKDNSQIISIGIILLILITIFNILPLIIINNYNSNRDKFIENYINKYNYKDNINQDTINKDNICSICLENINKEDFFCYKDCLHPYHLECIKKWIVYNKICPLCRKDYP